MKSMHQSVSFRRVARRLDLGDLGSVCDDNDSDGEESDTSSETLVKPAQGQMITMFIDLAHYVNGPHSGMV